jgi:hypothetical protein
MSSKGETQVGFAVVEGLSPNNNKDRSRQSVSERLGLSTVPRPACHFVRHSWD